MANPSTLDARPRLVKGGAENAEVREGRRNVAAGLMWVLAGLLAFSVGAAALQTERLDRMTGRAAELAAQAEALQAELTSAQAEIRAFEAERALVRESVADLALRIGALYEVVHPDGTPTPAPSAEPVR